MKQLALYFFSLLLLISCATVEPIIIESPEGINYDVSSAQIKLDSSDIIKTEQPIQKTRIIESINGKEIKTTIPFTFNSKDLYEVKIDELSFIAISEDNNSLLSAAYYLKNENGFLTIISSNDFSYLNLDSNVEISVFSKDKDGYIEYILSTLNPVEDKSLFTSNEEYLQFFNHKAGIIGENKLFTASYPESSERLNEIFSLARKYSIKTIINYSGSIMESGEFNIINVNNAHDLFISMADNKGPYLIFSKPDSNTSLVVALLEALMGARLSAIEDCYMRYFESKYSLSKSDYRYNIIKDAFTNNLKMITGASELEDKALLHLSVNYLKNSLSLTTNDISSLRLALR